jgi:hypothetical protein
MLFSRITLFIVFQTIFAALFTITGTGKPWLRSADWWLVVVILTNLTCIGLLIRFFSEEGACYRSLFRFDRKHWKKDLLTMGIITLVFAPVTYLPNIYLGKFLFGSSEATLALFIRPLPFWVVYAGFLLFPLTQALAELPTYFGYVMPRFQKSGIAVWLAVLLPSLMLGFQHLAVPLLFDARFIAWRAFMYIPFALLVGITLHWRPRLLPYMVVVHFLMDLSFMAMFLDVAYAGIF